MPVCSERRDATVDGALITLCLPALERGGMERVTINLVEGFLAAGYRVDVLLERCTGEYLSQVPAAARVVGLRKASKWLAYGQLIKAWPIAGLAELARYMFPGLEYLPIRRLPSVVDYLNRARPQAVLVAHGRMPLFCLWASRIAAQPTSIVVIEHSTPSRWIDVFKDQPAKHRRWQHRVALARQLYPRAAQLVGVSKDVSADAIRTYRLQKGMVRTLYNPVIGRASRIETPAASPHPWFDARPRLPIVLGVGRLVAEKNFSALLDAFALLRATREARLIIVGDGEERDHLMRQADVMGIGSDVSFPGWVADITPYFLAADLCVMTSWFEGLGLVLIESMAAGCPVVSVDCPSGPREVLADGRHGPLVAPGDAHALSKSMTQRLDAPRDSEQLRRAAERFSIASCMEGYLKLVDELSGSA